MKRICPQCKKQLEETEYFFCSACGYKLDDELAIFSVPFTTRVSYFQNVQVGKKKISFSFPKIHEKVLIAVLLVLVVILSGIVIFHFTRIQEALKKNVGFSAPIAAVNVSEPEPYKIDTSLGIEEMDFSLVEMTKYVPYDVDFFVEGSDLVSSANLFEDISFDSSSSLFPYVEIFSGPYVFFGNFTDEGWEYALVVMTSGTIEEIDSTIEVSEEDVDEEVTAEVYSYEDHIVYTNSVDFKELIENTSAGIAKNVTHMPQYNLSKNNMPESGQVRFMNFNDNIDEIYNKALSSSPGEAARVLMESAIKEGFDKFVLNKK